VRPFPWRKQGVSVDAAAATGSVVVASVDGSGAEWNVDRDRMAHPGFYFFLDRADEVVQESRDMV
jgi:hypothetical protein